MSARFGKTSSFCQKPEERLLSYPSTRIKMRYMANAEAVFLPGSHQTEGTRFCGADLQELRAVLPHAKLHERPRVWNLKQIGFFHLAWGPFGVEHH